MVTIYRILYIDDEPDLLEIGKLFLERSGQFIIDIITSASDALKLLNSCHYDAIVSDYQMPGMNGIEFLKKVRTSGNTIPFILFTGRGREEIVIEAINNGANFYLQKGGDPSSQFAELEHKIRQAVQQRKAEDELRAAYEQITASEEELRAQYDEMVILQKQTDETQQMLQQVLNTVPVRVFWKDLELRYLGCNEPFARDAGFLNPADLIGKTDFDMGWKEQAELYRADDRTVIETGIPKIGYEEPQTTSNGNRIWLRTSKIPLQAPGGKIIGILGTYEDITDRVKVQENLQAANTQITAQTEELRCRLATIEASQEALLKKQ
jgi:PAS domain S-box-containing protein